MFVCASLIAACSPRPATPPDPKVSTSSPLPAAASHGATAAPNTVEGVVLETMDASSYTYVRVKTANGEIWAASTTFKIAVGDTVIVPLENALEHFNSPTLKRDFPVIYFASHIGRPGDPSPAAAAVPNETAATDDPASLVAAVPPAPGGVPVASIVSQPKDFAGKSVTIRGRVVKYNGGILGMNWMHIQDGSGVLKDGTHDILVTSLATAKVGDVVTVTGTVAVNKDFGAGYSYGVLVQDARVTVK